MCACVLTISSLLHDWFCHFDRDRLLFFLYNHICLGFFNLLLRNVFKKSKKHSSRSVKSSFGVKSRINPLATSPRSSSTSKPHRRCVSLKPYPLLIVLEISPIFKTLRHGFLYYVIHYTLDPQTLIFKGLTQGGLSPELSSTSSYAQALLLDQAHISLSLIPPALMPQV